MVIERLRNGTFWNRSLLAVVDSRDLVGSGGFVRLPLREESTVSSSNKI